MTDCWEWPGAYDQERPYCYAEGEDQNAARYIYSLAFGRFHSSFHVLHKCDNAKCVNPDHLYLGDSAQNVIDRTMRLRGKRWLSKEQYFQVVNLLGTTKKSQEKIAVEVGISQTTVCAIDGELTKGKVRIYA